MFDISAIGTPGRVRLLDCRALLEDGDISLVELLEFPTALYSAISYPWRGVVPLSRSPGTVFAVKGAEDGDPVGVDALRHASAASIARGLPYLWLDRLCIMQTNREDKRWQIKVMHKVYQSCQLCIILPGGVQCLVPLDTETPWIHRSWTLQEALAPPRAEVLFAWKLGPGSSITGGKHFPIDEAILGQSAMADLALILQACAAGTLSFEPAPSIANPFAKSHYSIEASMFSSLPEKLSRSEIPFWRPQRKLLAPNVVALTMAMDPWLMSDVEIRGHAIWQSALMRTSSRPVDMVFSIMGLFGVSLDPAAFHVNDRRGATIALARAILESGGKANWLGISSRMPPDGGLSIFPTFPRTSVAGTALVLLEDGRIQEASELVDPVYPVSEALTPLPGGSMDEHGRFTFTTKAVEVYPSDAETGIVALDGTFWSFDYPTSAPTSLNKKTFVALLGWFNAYYPGHTDAHDTDNIHLLLLEEEQDQFRRRSTLKFHRNMKQRVLSWESHNFCIAAGIETSDASVTESFTRATYTESEPAWPRVPPRQTDTVTIRDELTREARWAIPQHVLERMREGST